MPESQPTTTGPARPTNFKADFQQQLVLLSILHAAASQDGTLDTAMESLHAIEDLAMSGLHR